MSVSFPSPEFPYSGSRYNFIAVLYADRNVDSAYVLNNQQVSQFTYTNALNKLVLEGELDYVDAEGKIVNYIHSTFLNLDIGFTKLKQAVDGSIATKSLDTKFQFKCSFIVDKIEILHREENVISYKFYLVSDNWLKCSQTLDYTNYDQDPMPILSIVQACIEKNDLTAEVSSFQETNTDVKINYMTNGNDDLFTTTSYLLNRLYFNEKRDDSMKFLVYDEHAQKYRLFDLSKTDDTKTGMNAIILAMDKSTMEHISYEQQNNLGSIVSFPKTKLIKTMYDFDVATYELSSNQLSSYQISSDETVNYYNNHQQQSDLGREDKLSRLSAVENVAKNLLQRQCIWNNNIQIYNDIADDMANDNALIVNTVGNILRKPSDIVFIDFPQDMSKVRSDKQSEYDDFKVRYKRLVGSWITAKVVHIISPARKIYRQNLVLFKNYVEKLKGFETRSSLS